jgi:protein-L-isoaspartate(D-aspartate) O-methyltransferase
MAELLELEGPERVLEVGTGSGYSAAVLAHLGSHVVSVERDPELARGAGDILARLSIRNVELRVGDGSAGVPDRAPFDAIVVTAAAERDPPPALLAQLVAEGTLVCPVDRAGDEQLVRVRRGQTERIAAVHFVPLVEGEG